jgi:protein FRA10AC1
MDSQGFNTGDYNSEFEYDSEIERKRAKRSDLAHVGKKKKIKKPHQSEVTEEYNRDEGRKDRFHILSLDAYDRHKKFINDYLQYYGGSMKQFERDASRDRTDHDVIKEHHQFLWEDEDGKADTWESRLAKKYYDKLFKEYCICDLSRYKENKVALRWRIESEVFSGKGQFACGNKKCQETDDLKSWEVNFGYVERDQKKNALVKIRLCPDCSRKLNYHHKKREAKAKRKSSAEDVIPGTKCPKTDDTNAGVREGAAEVKRETDGSSSTEDSPATSSTKKLADLDKDEDLWKNPVQPAEEVSKEDEFEDYFTDMFL